MWSAAAQHDERLARRIARFADAPHGSFAWTRDADGGFRLGRLTGPWRYDAAREAEAVDLVHVRPCHWRDATVGAAEVPAAVLATFARGGRNLQRIHGGAVLEAATEQLWDRLS